MNYKKLEQVTSALIISSPIICGVITLVLVLIEFLDTL